MSISIRTRTVPKDFPSFAARLATNPSIGRTANPELTVKETPMASTAHAATLSRILTGIRCVLSIWNGREVNWMNIEYRKVSRSWSTCFFPTFFSTAVSQTSSPVFTMKLNRA